MFVYNSINKYKTKNIVRLLFPYKTKEAFPRSRSRSIKDIDEFPSSWKRRNSIHDVSEIIWRDGRFFPSAIAGIKLLNRVEFKC